jgi:hypothetical protein
MQLEKVIFFSIRVDRLNRVEPASLVCEWGRVGLVPGGCKQGRVGSAPRATGACQGRVGLVGFIWPHYFGVIARLFQQTGGS